MRLGDEIIFFRSGREGLNLLSGGFFSEFFGGFAHISSELSSEVTWVGEANFFCDLLNRQVGIRKEFFGGIDSHEIQVCGWSDPQLLFEEPAERRSVHSHIPGNVL